MITRTFTIIYFLPRRYRVLSPHAGAKPGKACYYYYLTPDFLEVQHLEYATDSLESCTTGVVEVSTFE
jgi:hypothetical protein